MKKINKIFLSLMLVNCGTGLADYDNDRGYIADTVETAGKGVGKTAEGVVDFFTAPVQGAVETSNKKKSCCAKKNKKCCAKNKEDKKCCSKKKSKKSRGNRTERMFEESNSDEPNS